MSDQQNDRRLIAIDQIFDPESIDWEEREYNYLVTVTLMGYTRQRYFLELHDATEWAYDKVLGLQATISGGTAVE